MLFHALITNLLIFHKQFYEKNFGSGLAYNRRSLYICITKSEMAHAEVAQLVERNLAKVEVASSNLVFCSK